MSPPDVEVRRLLPTDDRSAFRSGDVELDRFFHRYAGQNPFRHHLGTTWVAVAGSGIVGFATVSAAHLEVGALPAEVRRKLPSYPVPVLRLARLAVQESAADTGVGRVLLRAVFALAWRMADDFGCAGVVVDAKPQALGFYARLGFTPLAAVQGELGDRPAPRPLFLELGAVPRPSGFERDTPRP